MRRCLLLIIAVTGCGTSIREIAINPAPHAMHARSPESVQVFTSGPPQGRQFTDVAYLEAEQQSGYSLDDTPQFMTDLRQRAAQLGCDGLVIGAPTSAVAPPIVFKTPVNQKGIVATCIVYSDGEFGGGAMARVSAPSP